MTPLAVKCLLKRQTPLSVAILSIEIFIWKIFLFKTRHPSVCATDAAEDVVDVLRRTEWGPLGGRVPQATRDPAGSSCLGLSKSRKAAQPYYLAIALDQRGAGMYI